MERTIGRPIQNRKRIYWVENSILNDEDMAFLWRIFVLTRLPIFIDGERTLNQSMAIARYLGRGLDLVPADPWEEAAVDAVILTINDLLSSFMALFREQDETKKETVKKEIIEETIPFYFSRFEKILKENNGHVGKQLTWADFVFVGLVELVEPILQFDIQEKYPVVKELVKKIHGLPGVKEYLAQSWEKQARKQRKSRWPSPPTDIRNPREIPSALPDSWIGIGYLMEGNQGDGVGYITYTNSRSRCGLTFPFSCLITLVLPAQPEIVPSGGSYGVVLSKLGAVAKPGGRSIASKIITS
ncbi:Glutathione S-transferase [Eumeta japonica]|uniref:glutathione transferase n=1 Tax=Eumeta variegata TaxID=151549 RepID=A0A4C1YQU0_EUMVA|nr:Glutathione S-transferase [Eumeta japonica]